MFAHCHGHAFPRLPVTDALWRSILSRDWDEVLERISLCPWEASYRFQKPSKRKSRSSNAVVSFCPGATCLHAACLMRAPFGVVERLLHAFKTAIFLQDDEGWTALHLNLIYGSCQDTTLLLIRHGGPNVARIQANYVGSPFHLACRHKHSLQVLRELLLQDPQQLKTTTVEEMPPGRYPGDLIWHVRSRAYAAETSNTAPEASQTEMRRETPPFPVLERLYLCLAALRGDWDETRHTLQEVLAYQHLWCSDQRCRYLFQYMEQNPHSVQQWFQGELPLHTAAKQQPSVSLTTPMDSTTTSLGGGDSVLSALLERYPDATRIPDRRTGRLPLHHALASHRNWFQGIRDLVRVHVGALELCDPITGLWPVLLAALPTSTSSGNIINNNHDDKYLDVPQLNTIFNLLCSNPSVLPSLLA